MELNDVIRSRHSIRAFLSDPVPRETIEKIVDLGRWAPSWGNTQPWEIVVADGEKARDLAGAIAVATMEEVPSIPDIKIPDKWPEAHQARYVELGKGLLNRFGIERSDTKSRQQHYANMARFFGAPTIIYLCIDRRLNEPYACLDLGSIGTTFCYLARQEGLGTCYLAASMLYPHIVRRVLGIRDDKKIVIGIAVGTPDPDAPGSLFRAGRDPMEKILCFA